MKKYCFGIDVGGTTIKIGFFLTSGKLLEKWEIPTRTENCGANILPDAASFVNDRIQELGISKEEIEGVGIAVPGPVNDEGIISGAVNLSWGEKNLPEELGSMLDLPVKAGNDANVAAFGEMWQGAGKGCKDLIMVTLGTGVGGGIIVNGKILNGAHGAGGEIGHANLIAAEEDACNCGNVGCLEQRTSATGLTKLANIMLKKSHKDSSLRECEVNAKSIFDAMKAGDELAGEIVDKFAAYLGNAMAIFACVTDPEIILIGGGVSKAGQVLIDAVRPYFVRDTFPACKQTPIAIASLGNDAGIYGAARLVLD